MTHSAMLIGRRDAAALAATAFATLLARLPARADANTGASLFGPVKALDDALIAAMRAGDTTPFDQRYQVLEPVIERVFDLNAVLAASVGLSWQSIPYAQKSTLSSAFRRYTVSSYVANFNGFNGQRFDILPDVRAVGSGEMVVHTRLIRPGESPVELDYVMRPGPAGWQIVDVLTDGSISRVAVQRSDFRELLASGGATALAAGLERKVANLSGSMQG
jgi:phospholipid transport system substrate-binding protein